MDNIEEKLGAILNNPQMMTQIMSMAQSLGSSDANPQNSEKDAGEKGKGNTNPDLSLLSGLAGQGSIDRNQRQLLQALSPYLSKERLSKLENAMRAAKMAKLASAFLGSGGLQMLSGR